MSAKPNPNDKTAAARHEAGPSPRASDGAAATSGPAAGGPRPSPALDPLICFALYTATSHMMRLYRGLLDPLGLTYPQYLAMLLLWDREPQSVGALGQAMGLDSGTLTPLLKRLESAGLIARTRDPADERRVLVSLTPQGRQLREKAAGVGEGLICQIDMPLADLGQLRTLLRQFIASTPNAAD